MSERIHITSGEHAGEEGELKYEFISYKFAGDIVAEIDGRREIVFAGEYERSEG